MAVPLSSSPVSTISIFPSLLKSAALISPECNFSVIAPRLYEPILYELKLPEEFFPCTKIPMPVLAPVFTSSIVEDLRLGILGILLVLSKSVLVMVREPAFPLISSPLYIISLSPSRSMSTILTSPLINPGYLSFTSSYLSPDLKPK